MDTDGQASDRLQALLQQVGNGDETLSSRELQDAIARLEAARAAAAQREEEARQQQEAQAAHIAQVTSMKLPPDWENAFTGDPRAAANRPVSVPDALVLSLRTLGRVDIEYISAVTGQTCRAVIKALGSAIYQNPDAWDECFYRGWETADEYLSGNLMEKLDRAWEASRQYGGYFDRNVSALRDLLPPSLDAGEIFVTLGSPWVPTDVIDDFITYLLGPYQLSPVQLVRHDAITGTWEIPWKTRYYKSVASSSTYGTQRREALFLLEHALNLRAAVVEDEIPCSQNASGKRRVINQEETVLAMEKQEKIVRAFQDWVWRDRVRRSRLTDIYQRRYGCIRRRVFDGSFLDFPTMSAAHALYPRQKDAVARILFSPNTLLAHSVGAGKTYIMVAAGMELRRLGLARKNLYVVPNNLVGQWRSVFLELYPQADLLCVEPARFTPKIRNWILATIRDEDFDGIIMAYSCFERIPLSKVYFRDQLERQLADMTEALHQAACSTARLRQQKEALERAIAALEPALAEDSATVFPEDSTAVFFDELGINTLFVDEAHNFKNVPIDTRINHVLGVSSGGSAKCQDMLDKVHCVQQQNGGRGVVLATGTPITNSITDLFVMQQYLQSEELARAGLQSFDSWVGMFAQRIANFEVDVDTSRFRLAIRLGRFHNLPELTNLLASAADFYQAAPDGSVPDFAGYDDIVVARTPALQAYLRDISVRADRVRAGLVRPRKDNMLKITTDGRKAALDMQLVDPWADRSYQSKAIHCAEKVFQIYRETQSERCAQLIFCDSSTPKDSFNLYDELADLLTAMGVPRQEIAYVHDAATEKQRSALFARTRRGEVRILMGSTFKLGLGVNVQDRLAAIHHLDVPWRPADMVQREGRILRQGNQNEQVRIFRYITEGSFDAYSWQLLESKQRFITELLSGSLHQRSGSDVEDTVLSYAEVKALAVGDPLIKQRVETDNELHRALTLQRKLIEDRQRMTRELQEIPERIRYQRELIAHCQADLAFYRANCRPYSQEERRDLRQQIFLALHSGRRQSAAQTALSYQGFQLLLNDRMTEEKPSVFLRRQGQYLVELGDSELGILTRLDHALSGLGGHLDMLSEGLQAIQQRESALRAELAFQPGYDDQIRELKEALRKLDHKLGLPTP